MPAKSKWADFWAAIEAMQIGDPPLRWSVTEADYRSAYQLIVNRYHRSDMEIRIKSFREGNEIWVVRLPNRLPGDSPSL